MTLQTSPSQESRDIEVVPVLIMIIGNDRLGVSRRLGHGYGDLVMGRGVEGVGGRGGVAGGVGRLINGLFCYRLGLGLGESRHLDEDAAGGSRLLELFAGEPGADRLRCDVNAGNDRLDAGPRSASARGVRAFPWRKPVAMTVILTSSPIVSSRTAPKMMLASSWAAFWMRVEASLTSLSLSELEPLMLMRMPRAPSMAPSSSSGRGHGGLGGFDGAVRSAADGGAHDGVAHAGHGGLHVGEVAVDDAGDGDDVGDALHALAEHVVGDAEGLEEAGVLGDGEQLLVGDDDHGVDAVEQLLHAALGLRHAALAFEGEGPGDDGDGERAHLAGERRDDGRGAGAGAAAEAGGDEDHVGAFEGFDDLLGIFERGLAADVGVGAGAEAAGELDAELQLDGRLRELERLAVGVGDDELDAFDAGADHAVDGVAAAAADADDLDPRAARDFVVVLNADFSGCPGFVLHRLRLLIGKLPAKMARSLARSLWSSAAR